jgi:DNA repair protein RecN (Recombination protein N)
VLKRLTIRDFGIIENLEWRPGPGLNVITGETGAGKSLVLDALDVLLGRRVGQEIIRTGSSSAVIGRKWWRRRPIARELRLSSDARWNVPDVATPSVDGRTVTVRNLKELASAAFDLHGPNQQFSLLEAGQQLSMLDTYAGTADMRAAFAALAGRLMEVRTRLRTLLSDERQLARRRDLLTYEVGEIRAAGPVTGEEAELEEESHLLANTERLRAAVAQAWEHLSGGGQESLRGRIALAMACSNCARRRTSTAILRDWSRRLNPR